MNDGAIVFKTKIDNSDVQKDLDKVKREIEKSQKTIAETETARLPLLKDAEQLKAKLQEARRELAYFKDEQAAAQAAIGGPSLEDHMAASGRLPELNAAVDANKAKVDQLEKEWRQVNGKLDSYNAKLTKAKMQLTKQRAKAAQLSKGLAAGGTGMAQAMEKAGAAVSKVTMRLGRILKQVLFYSLVYKAVSKVATYLGKALKTNKQFTAELAKLKGALLTAFQPIYEFLVPVLMALMRIATHVVTAIARVASLLGGKSMSQYAKSAEALYKEANAIEETGKAAKEAQKSLAGFDEINQLSDNSKESESSGQGAAGADFSTFNSDAIKAEVDELVLFLSGALLVIGMILALSGANIPLGIGLMAAGAIGLAAEASTNWDTVRKILEDNAALVAGISAILLVIGIVLCFCGFLPLGIGLIVVGAAGLVTEAVVNWDSVKGPIKDTVASILAIISGASIVLGILLCLSGAGLGAGLALIAAGVAGSVVAWNVSDNPITRFVKNMANTVIAFVNMIIWAVNELFHIEFKGLSIAGVQLIPEIDLRLINIPPIPLLAQGAVLPPNKPFMAMVGDQKHGTNIEAPLSTIQEAVAEVMADYEAANLAGHEATVAALREILEAVLGIEVGDTTIGMAANRYNQKMAIIKGGGA